MFGSILLICLTIAANTAVAAEWELERKEDGISVYTRSVNDSPYREFKGVIELETSLASALGLLDDTSACQDWLHLCEESRILEQRGWSERFIYQVSDLPFPAATRDAIFRARISQDAGNVINIELTSQPDFIPETRYVRIRNSHGKYVLEPIAEDTVRFTLVMFTDPAGSLPAFIVNRLITDFPYKSLSRFRELVKRERYQVLEFEYNEEGQAVGLKNKRW